MHPWKKRCATHSRDSEFDGDEQDRVLYLKEMCSSSVLISSYFMSVETDTFMISTQTYSSKKLNPIAKNARVKSIFNLSFSKTCFKTNYSALLNRATNVIEEQDVKVLSIFWPLFPFGASLRACLPSVNLRAKSTWASRTGPTNL